MTRVARSTIASVTTPIPIDLHEWVSFEDHEEDRTWVFDVTFLTSSWNCIFGNGCQGVLTGPAEELVQGCCSYGAHFVDADDVARVEAVAATLTAEEWQFKDKAKKKGTITTNDDGDTVTASSTTPASSSTDRAFQQGRDVRSTTQQSPGARATSR